MSTDTLPPSRPAGTMFRHEAMLYGGADDFVAGTTAFLRAGIGSGEPALVVVSADKIRKLRAALGTDADAVHFADMAAVGSNPARIIPAWRRFIDDHVGTGRRVRGIGEPIWAERTPAQLVECQRHEDLLNLAFAGSTAWWLLCPYDVQTLAPTVIEEAHRSHPFVMQGRVQQSSHRYRGLDAVAAPFDAPLPAPPDAAIEIGFDAETLSQIRAWVAHHAVGAALRGSQVDEMVFAVNEIASNSLRYGGGSGVLRMWDDGDAFICEIRDRGQIREPLVGRQQPPMDTTGGRGLWLANQLCDLVQIRSSPAGTVVRLHALR